MLLLLHLTFYALCRLTVLYFDPNKIIYGISFAALCTISLFKFKLFRCALSPLRHTNHRRVSCFYLIPKICAQCNFFLLEGMNQYSFLNRSFTIWRRFLFILKTCIMGRFLWKTTRILIFWEVIWWTKNMFWNSGSLIFVIAMCQEIVKAVICKRSCDY